MKKNNTMRFKLASHDMKLGSKMRAGQSFSHRQGTEAAAPKFKENAINSVDYGARSTRLRRAPHGSSSDTGQRTPQAGVATRLALPLMPLPAQHFSLFVLAHLLAAFFYNTTHVSPSIRAPEGAAAM